MEVGSYDSDTQLMFSIECLWKWVNVGGGGTDKIIHKETQEYLVETLIGKKTTLLVLCCFSFSIIC